MQVLTNTPHLHYLVRPKTVLPLLAANVCKQNIGGRVLFLLGKLAHLLNCFFK